MLVCVRVRWDRAWALGWVENIADLFASLENSRRCLIGERQLFFKENGREDYFGPLDTKIICWIEHRPYLSYI